MKKELRTAVSLPFYAVSYIFFAFFAVFWLIAVNIKGGEEDMQVRFHE